MPLFAVAEVTFPPGLAAVSTYLWTTLGTLVSTIAAQPLLLIPVGLGFVGGVIGLGKKLMGTGRRRR